jgi:hypothetical protein
VRVYAEILWERGRGSSEWIAVHREVRDLDVLPRVGEAFLVVVDGKREVHFDRIDAVEHQIEDGIHLVTLVERRSLKAYEDERAAQEVALEIGWVLPEGWVRCSGEGHWPAVEELLK